MNRKHHNKRNSLFNRIDKPGTEQRRRKEYNTLVTVEHITVTQKYARSDLHRPVNQSRPPRILNTSNIPYKRRKNEVQLEQHERKH